MGKIHVTDREGGQHDIELDSGVCLMEPLRELAGGIEALCGGMCSCATCHIFIAKEWADKLEPVEGDELELLEETESFRADESRLSCQITFSDELDGISFTIAPEE